MKSVIFGAGGLLGSALGRRLVESGLEVVGAFGGRKEADIADAEVVGDVLARLRPEVVFNAAAYTNVDGAEDEPEAARRANAEGPEVLARACAAVDARLVHYSTDFVFDGEKATPYDEDDPPSPRGVYAETKAEGERRVLGAWPKAFVVRVGCLYGRGGRNFPSTLLSRLRKGELIRADGVRRVSPTWAGEVARLSVRLCSKDRFGIYHGTALGETSWVDFARFLAENAGIAGASIESVDGTTLKLKAPRPMRAILVSRNLPRVGLEPLPTWREQALAYLESEPGIPQSSAPR